MNRPSSYTEYTACFDRWIERPQTQRLAHRFVTRWLQHSTLLKALMKLPCQIASQPFIFKKSPPYFRVYSIVWKTTMDIKIFKKSCSRDIILCMHSSEKRGLRSTILSGEMLQDLPYL